MVLQKHMLFCSKSLQTERVSLGIFLCLTTNNTVHILFKFHRMNFKNQEVSCFRLSQLVNIEIVNIDWCLTNYRHLQCRHLQLRFSLTSEERNWIFLGADPLIRKTDVTNTSEEPCLKGSISFHLQMVHRYLHIDADSC